MFRFFKDIHANGDVVGRDKISNIHLPQPTQLDKLNDLYRQEYENNEVTREMMDELNHLSSSKPGKRDLSTKLSAAGFDYLTEEAEELKELISKFIMKHQNYKSAQQIITLLLSEVKSIFDANIKPKLTEVEDIHQLNQIIKVYLENEIIDKLGENVLNIYHRQINGMMFFLTGNCHLEWE